MFSYNGIKLEINKRKIFGKCQVICKLNNVFLNNPSLKKKSQGKL